jgi:hypothetical protein
MNRFLQGVSLGLIAVAPMIYLLPSDAAADIGTRGAQPAVHAAQPSADLPSRWADRAVSRSSSAKTPSGETMRFTRLTVKDPGAGNIEACNFLIPAGWKAEGGVRWYTNEYILARLLMTITDPGTGAAIEFLPSQYFQWHPGRSMPQGGNYMGCIIWPPISDATQFVQLLQGAGFARRLQGAKVVKTEDLPKVAAQLQQSHGDPTTARCTRVRYEYRDSSREWEEDVYVAVLYTPMRSFIFWAGSAYSFRAPRGQLDRFTPIMNTTIQTQRRTPQWFAYYTYVRELFENRMKQGIRSAGLLSEAISRNSAEIQRMYEDSYRRANQSQDRIARSYSEYVRGVDTYRNPYEDRPIQLPSGYNGVWVNRSGDYVLSNQAGFNPNVGSNVEWRRMDRSR